MLLVISEGRSTILGLLGGEVDKVAEGNSLGGEVPGEKVYGAWEVMDETDSRREWDWEETETSSDVVENGPGGS